MARLESTLDLMHVPTPLAVCRRLADFFDIPENAHILDPCCGSGAALATVADGRGHLYGVELELDRAEAARSRIPKVLCCAAQETRMSASSFGMIFLNPPYADSMDGRLELVFLERALTWLAPGGVLVFIVKAGQYTGRVPKLLADYFEDFRHWRFPDPFFDGPDLAFNQTVLVCRKKSMRSMDPGRAAKLFSETRGDGASMLPQPELAPATKYRVPPGRAPDLFLSGQLTEAAMGELLAKSPIAKCPPVRNDLAGRPPLPLKKGHLALVLASGLIDGIYGKGTNLHVAKGIVQRSERSDKTIESDSAGRPTVTIRETMGFEIVIRALTRDGVIHEIAGAKPEEPSAVEAQVDAGEEEVE